MLWCFAMLGERCSCAILERSRPSSATKSPLSLLFPLHTRIPSVSPLFPLDTKTGGYTPPPWYDQSFHFGNFFGRFSPSTLLLRGSEFQLRLQTRPQRGFNC